MTAETLAPLLKSASEAGVIALLLLLIVMLVRGDLVLGREKKELLERVEYERERADKWEQRAWDTQRTIEMTRKGVA